MGQDRHEGPALRTLTDASRARLLGELEAALAGVRDVPQRGAAQGSAAPLALAAQAAEPLAEGALVAAIGRLVEAAAGERLRQVRLASRDALGLVVRVRGSGEITDLEPRPLARMAGLARSVSRRR
jgi:hypothetical protein